VVSVACNLCGSGESDILYDFQPLRIVRCRSCGLAYTSPRLSQAEIAARLYGPQYWQGFEAASPEQEQATRATIRGWIKLLENRAGKRQLALLEVGAGLGMFLDEAHSAGHDIHGVEPSEHAVAAARRRFGLSLQQGVLDDVDPRGFEPLDAMVMLAVIEHLPDPFGALEQARELLAPSGLLLLSTGVFGSVNHRVAGRGWTIIAPEEHLYYFSKGTLRRLLEKAGFEVVQLETNGFLINPLTRQRPLVYLFNNRITHALGLERLTKALRLGDEMFVLARRGP
jgi:2-polyprenyl-3-methyl-5-hydroxy-6-metoxy-1,4-benzoquinol methylase